MILVQVGDSGRRKGWVSVDSEIGKQALAKAKPAKKAAPKKAASKEPAEVK